MLYIGLQTLRFNLGRNLNSQNAPYFFPTQFCYGCLFIVFWRKKNEPKNIVKHSVPFFPCLYVMTRVNFIYISSQIGLSLSVLIFVYRKLSWRYNPGWWCLMRFSAEHISLWSIFSRMKSNIMERYAYTTGMEENTYNMNGYNSFITLQNMSVYLIAQVEIINCFLNKNEENCFCLELCLWIIQMITSMYVLWNSPWARMHTALFCFKSSQVKSKSFIATKS